jgi:hypothetical protein
MHSLTSALYGGEWSASRLGRFTHRERAPGTYWIGGCVEPRTVLESYHGHPSNTLCHFSIVPSKIAGEYKFASMTAHHVVALW